MVVISSISTDMKKHCNNYGSQKTQDNKSDGYITPTYIIENSNPQYNNSFDSNVNYNQDKQIITPSKKSK